jgi:hypothetical protein
MLYDRWAAYSKTIRDATDRQVLFYQQIQNESAIGVGNSL